MRDQLEPPLGFVDVLCQLRHSLLNWVLSDAGSNLHKKNIDVAYWLTGKVFIIGCLSKDSGFW
jgi:hypothetical protein